MRPIILPTLTYNGLDQAITDYWSSRGLDVLLYLKADLKYGFFYNQLMASRDDVLLNQVVPAAFAQIGFASIFLMLCGTQFIIRKHRKQLIWFIMVVIFFWLSLGVPIYFNHQPIEWFPTLYPLLLNNPIILALREPFRFQIIMLFALSILIAFGLQWLFQRFSTRLGRIVITLLTLSMFFEISSFPIPYRNATLSPAYDYVTENHDGPIIIMPMGRQSVKYSMYTQMHHQQPLPEGMIARLPEGVYDFIQEENLFLRDLSDIDNLLRASDELLASWESELDELLEIGFHYIIVHRLEHAGRILVIYPYQERMFFMEIDPDFETDVVAVYDLQKLRDHPPQGDPFAEEES